MEIKKPAIAGTLESSDCQVTVEAGEGKVDFSLESAVINQYGNQIKKVAYETLENLGIDNVKLIPLDNYKTTKPVSLVVSGFSLFCTCCKIRFGQISVK